MTTPSKASLDSRSDVPASSEPWRPLRFLFASLDVPFPVSSGRRLRNLALLRALRKAGHEIVMVAFADRDNDLTAPAELLGLCHSVEIIPSPSRTSTKTYDLFGRFRSLISSLPFGAERLRSKAFRGKIQERLQREEFDAIICDDIYVAPNLEGIGNAPMILNKHGIGAVVLERFLLNERNPIKRAYAHLELRKTRQWEAAVSSKSALILTCSAEDCAELRRLCPQARMAIVPNVIDISEYTATPVPSNHTVVFVAYLGWYPNQDAVEFFVRHVMPPLRKLVPDVRFVAAGRNPPEEFRNRLSLTPGVEFTGTVPDIRPVVAGAAVSVVPLRIGTGTRLKILEAAAMGRPVVSTTVGAEGLDFKAGEEIVIADEPEKMAREVAALLADNTRASRIAAAARLRVERDYSLAALGQSIDAAMDLIRSMVSRRT
jgi:glycosyltransferase involved in cell wall biosynthesis